MEGSRSVTLTDDYHFELRDIIYYYMGMSVDAGFGVLGDGERMASVGEHARMHCSRVLMLGCTF